MLPRSFVCLTNWVFWVKIAEPSLMKTGNLSVNEIFSNEKVPGRYCCPVWKLYHLLSGK